VESHVLFGPALAQGAPVWHRRSPQGLARLGYFGALGPWQQDALGFLSDCLEPARASLDIYAPSSCAPPAWSSPRVTFKSRIPPCEVPSTMRSYDAVVLPVSFEPGLRHLSEFNIATKMAECLASGTVTLLVAPRYAAMARLLGPRKAAVIVAEKTTDAMVEAVAFACDPAHRRDILRAASELVSSCLTVAAMRQIWAGSGPEAPVGS